jgi:hypothetical protein
MLLVFIGVAIGGGAIWALVKPSQQPASKQAQQMVVIRSVQPTITSTGSAVSEASPSPAQQPTITSTGPAVSEVSSSPTLQDEGKEARDREKLVEVCRNDVASLEKLHSQWTDTVKLASSTARIAASGPVGTLQTQRQQLNSMPANSCAEAARKHLLAAMDNTIEVFIRFMRNDSNSAFADLDDLVKDGKSKAYLARESAILFLKEIEVIKKQGFGKLDQAA